MLDFVFHLVINFTFSYLFLKIFLLFRNDFFYFVVFFIREVGEILNAKLPHLRPHKENQKNTSGPSRSEIRNLNCPVFESSNGNALFSSLRANQTYWYNRSNIFFSVFHYIPSRRCTNQDMVYCEFIERFAV